MIVKPAQFQHSRLARSLRYHFSLNLTPLDPSPDLNLHPQPPHPRIIECGFNYEFIIFIFVGCIFFCLNVRDLVSVI